jgi:hypothetical protein
MTNERKEDLEREIALDNRVRTVEWQLEAIASHLKLALEPGYTDQFGFFRVRPSVRASCKECGR